MLILILLITAKVLWIYSMIFYLRTSKTASSTINDWLGPDYSQNVTHNIRSLDADYNKSRIEKAINKHYFIFTTVRHPYTRTISCWQQAIRSSWIPKEATFDDYLNWNFRGTTEHIETHNMPISEYLKDYLDKINLVIKYENFQEKLVQMQQLFDMPIRRFGHFNPKTVKIDHKGLLTKERKEKIYETHKEDFKAFDYSKTIDL